VLGPSSNVKVPLGDRQLFAPTLHKPSRLSGKISSGGEAENMPRDRMCGLGVTQSCGIHPEFRKFAVNPPGLVAKRSAACIYPIVLRN